LKILEEMLHQDFERFSSRVGKALDEAAGRHAGHVANRPRVIFEARLKKITKGFA
jgi:hypothetical protein